jgi:hypothetical protein
MKERRSSDRRLKTVPVPLERRKEDRRQAGRRRSARVRVSLWVEEREGGNVYLLRASDISAEGIFFEKAMPQPIGSEMRLGITLPGEAGVILARGRVANVGRDPERLGVGLRFTEIEGDGAERLRAFLAALASHP